MYPDSDRIFKFAYKQATTTVPQWPLPPRLPPSFRLHLRPLFVSVVRVFTGLGL